LKQEIRERRTELLSLYGKGLDESDIITTIADKYKIKRASVYQDWYRRNRWLRDVSGFKEIENSLWESLYNLKKLSKDAYYLYLKGDNDSARVGALRLVADINFRMAEMIYEIKKDADLEDFDRRLRVLEESKKNE